MPRFAASAGQVTLAWLAAQGTDVVPVPGTKRRRHLDDNLGAVDLLLDASEVDRLDGLVAVGDRAADMTWVNRDTPLPG